MLDGHIALGEFPDHEAERLISVFSAGWRITVSRRMTNRRPELERLEGFDEIWALCPRKPRPGWRILGRFYASNVFIGLRAWPKEKLFGRYDHAAREVLDDWIELFGEQPPFRSETLDEYLGPGLFKDVDEDDCP